MWYSCQQIRLLVPSSPVVVCRHGPGTALKLVRLVESVPEGIIIELRTVVEVTDKAYTMPNMITL